MKKFQKEFEKTQMELLMLIQQHSRSIDSKIHGELSGDDGEAHSPLKEWRDES